MVLKDLDAWYKKWLLMAVGLLALTPLLVINTLVPPPIEITAWKDRVEFEFSDLQFAREFAEMNDIEHPDS